MVKTAARPAGLERRLETLPLGNRVVLTSGKIATVVACNFTRAVVRLNTGGVADAAEFAYLALTRRENVLGLQWSWFALKVEGSTVTGGTVRLPGAVTKNGKALPLVLKGRLLEVVRRRWERRVAACPFVFHRAGHRIVRFDAAWRAACTAVGLAGLRFHDLRRSGARNLRRAGVPESVIMRMGGWKTRSMFDRYNIVDEGDLAAAADAYDAFLDRALATDRKVIPLTEARAKATA